MARFLVFPPNHPPLASHLITWAQDPNPGLPHPKWVPITQLHHPPHCVSQNWTPVARFSVPPPLKIPSPSHAMWYPPPSSSNLMYPIPNGSPPPNYEPPSPPYWVNQNQAPAAQFLFLLYICIYLFIFLLWLRITCTPYFRFFGHL